MKNYTVFIYIFLLVFSCKSPEKLFQEGDYDKVIDKSLKKMLKEKADKDDKELLNKAYTLANQRDKEKIKLLRSENDPANWEEIYQLYLRLSNRQDELRKVTPFYIGNKKINYNYTDYTGSIAEAKHNAAAYYYQKGKSQMNLDTKEGYRQAYFCFTKTREYGGSEYTDLDQLIDNSRYLGTSHVLIELTNASRRNLPPDFFNNLLNINTSQLNSMWVVYDLPPGDRNTRYDYYVTIILQRIDVTPENYSTQEYTRSKRIQEGYKYAYDRKGKIKKDSLGHPVKIPKYKVLTCTIIRHHQLKTATINGIIEFASADPQRLLKSQPIGASSVFDHTSGRAHGDSEALEPEDLQLIRNKEVPFPDNLSMIYDCSETLRKAIIDAIRGNRNLIY